MSFKISIHDSAELASRFVAEQVCRQVHEKNNSVLGLPTGNTPVQTYQHLVQLYQKKEVSFSNVSTFNLDEYVNLDPEDINSYHYYMKNNFFKYVDIQNKNIHILNGLNPDFNQECLEFERQLQLSGGIDLQLLGIGTNGHIGFNEPGTSFSSKTGLVELAEMTIQDNSMHFMGDASQVPRKALSMGMETIFSAKKIILLALGSKKAEIVAELLKVTPTEDLPASLLSMHKDCCLVLDQEAANLIGI